MIGFCGIQTGYQLKVYDVEDIYKSVKIHVFSNILDKRGRTDIGR